MFEQTIDTYIRARFPIIFVQTSEEERALNAIARVCEGNGSQPPRTLITWDFGRGFQCVTDDKMELPPAADPKTALNIIEQTPSKDRKVFALLDLHDFWPKGAAVGIAVKRQLRNLSASLKTTQNNIIIISPVNSLPEELKNDVVMANLDLPDSDELEGTLVKLLNSPATFDKSGLTEQGRKRMAEAARGLTNAQALRAYSQVIVGTGSIADSDIGGIIEQKRQIIRDSGALEFFNADQGPSDVGGLEMLKSWLKLRQRAFGEDAKQYGLPAPKGISLIGIPGTGKSLCAKMIAGAWKMPLLRLDVGALFGSLVGQSEEQTRQAIKLAEAVAPCVLWIDELEKGFGQSSGDGGTSSRVFSSLLTWMQEKTAPVFVVATANDISKLPPELLRKGRFDEIFFMNLPTQVEREAIFQVHLRKRNRNPENFDIETLVDATDSFTGAEIEQIVIDAMYRGFDEGREFKTGDMLAEIEAQVPLAKSQKESIEYLQTWIKEGRAKSASAAHVEDAQLGEESIRLEL